MPWAKLDDGFAFHPKVMKAGPLAVALYIRALARAADLLTDGLVQRSDLLALTTYQQASPQDPEDLAQRLVDVGLWERSGDDFMIHDYLDYNPSADHVREDRKQKVTSGRRGGVQRAAEAKRTSQGRFEPDSPPDIGPDVGPGDRLDRQSAVVQARPRPRPRPRPRSPKRYLSSKNGSTSGLPPVDRWVGWDPAWAPFKAAWLDRGLELPPTISQREALWDVVDSRPQDAATWVREVPASAPAAGVVGHVLESWHRFQDETNRSLSVKPSSISSRPSASMASLGEVLRGPSTN